MNTRNDELPAGDPQGLPAPHVVTTGPLVRYPVITDPWTFAMAERRLPMHPAPGFVRLKVHNVAFCGSDRDLCVTGNKFTGYAGDDVATSFGHEFDATVLELGDGVKNIVQG